MSCRFLLLFLFLLNLFSFSFINAVTTTFRPESHSNLKSEAVFDNYHGVRKAKRDIIIQYLINNNDAFEREKCRKYACCALYSREDRSLEVLILNLLFLLISCFSTTLDKRRNR